MIKMKKILLFLAINLLFLPLFTVAGKKDAEYVLTEEDKSVLEQFDGKTITMGYLPGYSKVLAEHVMNILESELKVDIEGVEYQELNELYNAAESGEVDIASGLKKGDLITNLHYSKSIYRDYRLIVTLFESDVRSIEDLENQKVGFLKNDKNYRLTKEALATNNIEYQFYNTIDEVKQALYNNEIQGYICSSYMRDRFLTDPKLISRIALQDNPAALRFATGKEEFNDLIDIFGNVTGDLSNDMRDRAFLKKIEAYEDEALQSYISTQYPDIETMNQEIHVNTLRNNYPFSYKKDGEYEGLYIKLLDYFTKATGIEYKIMNQDEAVLADVDTLERLNTNEVQFVLGTLYYYSYENIIKLDNVGNMDYLISVSSTMNSDLHYSDIDDIKIGITEDLAEIVKDSTVTHQLVKYDATADAIKGMENHEFDILLTKQSVLDYYQRIEMNGTLIQNNYIKRQYPYEILANGNNVKLNQLFQDVARYYKTVHIGDNTTNTDIIASNFINDYLKMYNSRKM